jgi:gliding motility-associated-like protein
MNKFLCFGLLLLSAQIAQAQMPVVDSPEYQNQKSSGTLSGALPGNPAAVVPGNSFGGGVVDPLSCACYTEPDATWSTLVECDDCSSGFINIPFQFCFFGQTANGFYINNNGNLSFNNPVATFTPPPLPSAGQAVLGPYWADVDTRNNLGQVRYKITPTAAFINWVNVGYFNTQGDKRNTFSVIITNGNDPSIGIGNNVAFCYKDMQWTTGSASQGVNGFGGTPATVGANWGVNNQFIRIGTFNAPGPVYNGPNVVSQVSWLDFKSFKFNVCNSINVPPVLINAQFPGYTFQPDTCNSINGGVLVPNAQGNGICVGQTISGSLQFSGPENNQNVTVSATGPPGLVANTVTGNTPTINISYTPTMGTNGPQTITVTATDNGNPNLSTTITLTVLVTSPPYNPTISGPDFICPGGTATLTVNEFFNTYSWSGATTGNQQSVTGPAGTYNVTVTLGGCTLSTSKTVALFPLPSPVITGNNQVCAGSTTLLSTTLPYVGYSWSTGAQTPAAQAGTGTHTVTVTDVNGCVNTSPPFTITDYGQPSISAVATDASCFGFSDGALAVSFGGANGSETIVWAHDPTESSFTAAGLTSGTYTFVITDANACLWPSSGIVGEPAVLDFSLSTVDVTCPGGNDGAATVVNPTGGTQPYSFVWDGNPNQTGQTLSGFSLGNHSVTLTDANGCILSEPFTLAEISATPSISSVPVIESCPGASNGSINLSVNGGNPSFSFLWGNGESIEDIQNLPTGNYEVTVTDINGCTFSHSAFVGVGENLTINHSAIDVLCNGDYSGSIIISPVTGIAPFTVSMNGLPASLNNTNLQAGTYNFYMTDVNGCYYSFSETLTEPTPLLVDSTQYLISLGDFTNLLVTASGGVPPYAYSWLPTYNISCTDCPNPLCWAVNTTNYLVEVTDANGCLSYGEALVEVIQPPSLAPSAFTPNGDGLNDIFLASLVGVKDFEMSIFTRWGQKVFESDDIYKGWNGNVGEKLGASGIYPYKIFVRYINGKDETIHGNVLLLR